MEEMEMTRGEMNDVLVKFASESTKYREALKDDGRKVVSTQFGIEIPDNIKVTVLEESAEQYYFVLPHALESGAELSDADLEQVAGGGTFVLKAKCGGGMANTVVNVETKLF